MITKLYVKAANAVDSFKKNQAGVTAIEYGLIAAFIAMALVAFLPDLQKALGNLFNKLTTSINNGLACTKGSGGTGNCH